MSKNDRQQPASPAAKAAESSTGPQGLLIAGVVIVVAALGFIIFLIATGRGTGPSANMVAGANEAAPATGSPTAGAPAANGAAAAPAQPGPTPGGGELLPSGLRFEAIREGRGPQPTANDTVYFRYELRKFGGAVMESNLDAPRAAVMPVAALVPGFQEGLGRMRPGGEARFWVPPHLGYGNSPPDGIAPTDTLEFRVRLERVARGTSVGAPAEEAAGANETAPAPGPGQ